MDKNEAIEYANALKNNYTVDLDKLPEFCDIAISALKPTCKIDESNFSMEQYRADLQSAYDCGKAEALKGGWIPIVTRPMTEEEKAEYYGEYDPNEIQMYACPIPEDGQEVIITTCFGDVTTDTFYRDDGYYFETYCDDDEVVAWQPKPEPYKKGE